jgi:hypothetical protein
MLMERECTFSIKRGSFTLCSSLVLDFQYKGAKNGSVENKDCILGHFRVSLKIYIYNSRLIYIQEAKTEDMSFNFDTIENVHSLSINIKARGKYVPKCNPYFQHSHSLHLCIENPILNSNIR